MTTTEDEARRFMHDTCFGDRYWRYPGPNGQTSEEMLVEFYNGNRAMAAMSILSDAQELLEGCRNREPSPAVNGRLESVRQMVNKAKSILGDFSTEFHVQQLRAAGVHLDERGYFIEEVA